MSRGAQKNFARYAVRIGEEWKKDADRFDERYFKQAVARAIIFKSSERIVSVQTWYEGGYRANIVNYANALLSHALGAEDLQLDVEALWQAQRIPDSLSSVIASLAEVVNDELTSSSRGLSNVSEWAKKTDCWTAILKHLPHARSIVRKSCSDWAVSPASRRLASGT